MAADMSMEAVIPFKGILDLWYFHRYDTSASANRESFPAITLKVTVGLKEKQCY
jgi:hypothetical protein